MFTLDQVVPWGRSFDEYRRMFALSDADLRLRILGCGDGPASFNVEATAAGASIVSVDPIYTFDEAQLRQRIAETSTTVLEQTRANAHEFVWTRFRSVDELAATRLGAMGAFLRDFAERDSRRRYVAGALPGLPLKDDAFGLALCSHFLFLYSTHHDVEFHLAAIQEMIRVAGEARIFPLLALGGARSPHVEPVRRALDGMGLSVSIENVDYEFQRGGNQMMRIRRRSDGHEGN